MTNEASSIQTTPAVPLEYFERRGGPWTAVVHLMAGIGFVYAITIAVEQLAVFATSVMRLGPSWGWISSRSLELLLYVVIQLISLPAMTAMVVGAVWSRRLLPKGRTLLVWSAAATCVCWLISFAVNFGFYVSNVRNMSFPKAYVLGQAVGSISIMLIRDFVPVMLWIVFRKREVREVFDGS